MYTLTKDRLLFDLHAAYYKAIKRKRTKPYVEEFRYNLSDNLRQLADDLWNRKYVPGPSTCFVIDHPKKREVYAASFRDRIVHHLYYDYTYAFFEKTLIEDCYSCVEGRGTKYGIDRIRHHIESASENYTKKCHALKLDIKGYFMHIDKTILYEEAMKTIGKYRRRPEYNTSLDFDMIGYLTEAVISQDCTVDCINISPESAYVGLPESKRLSSTPPHCGLPIGNLTSQLFSNVYLNVLDQFAKRELKFRHYGRYVDDAVLISTDRTKIHHAISDIGDFLSERLHLSLQKGKTRVSDVRYGVEFLGAFLKPFRTYVSNQCLERISKTVRKAENGSPADMLSSYASEFGYLKQYDSYNIRTQLLNQF